ncbi:hypothetical protein [uncultured Alistipes sp.]|uniref:hypothetical protein n=1 Tax=uncultured Alistipes sp. TaxID=538949 RepID=UPI0025E908B1|nr:hypothetical protein [uncultured Alistipes sp.]
MKYAFHIIVSKPGCGGRHLEGVYRATGAPQSLREARSRFIGDIRRDMAARDPTLRNADIRVLAFRRIEG